MFKQRRISKAADVTPVDKNENLFHKGNLKRISILIYISKIYEKIMYNQVNDFFINKLSKYQCGLGDITVFY